MIWLDAHRSPHFADLVLRHGPPPAVIWLRGGNTSEERLQDILRNHLSRALADRENVEAIVEIP
jgi:predicted nuclease of predicted toxin-antitoxin system